LLEASLKSDPDISPQVIDARLADLLWDVDAALFSAPMLKSLVASGDVGRVANPDVRRELVVWSIRFDRLNSRAERATRFHDDRLLPYLEANASMPQIRNALRHAPGYPDKTENIGDINPYNVESPLDHSYLLKDSEFHALMIRHDGLISDLLYLTGGKAAANLDSMISTLEVEISKLD
jgi:hypothetical protein